MYCGRDPCCLQTVAERRESRHATSGWRPAPAPVTSRPPWQAGRTFQATISNNPLLFSELYLNSPSLLGTFQCDTGTLLRAFGK